jgi:membrane protein DedA with SNARE-associated domain
MPAGFDAFIQTLGAWGYPGLGLAALIEYVFPPFPGDTVVVLGGAWAEREYRSLLLVELVLTLGSVAGMALTWRLGRSLSERIRLAPEGSRLLGLQVGQIRKTQALMRDRGGWLLLANRFLPSFRSVLFVAAGAADVPLWRTLALGTVSAVLFNTLLLAVGVAVGDNAEAIADFLRTFRTASIIGVGVLALMFLGRFLWRRGRAQSHP